MTGSLSNYNNDQRHQADISRVTVFGSGYIVRLFTNLVILFGSVFGGVGSESLFFLGIRSGKGSSFVGQTEHFFSSHWSLVL